MARLWRICLFMYPKSFSETIDRVSAGYAQALKFSVSFVASSQVFLCDYQRLDKRGQIIWRHNGNMEKTIQR